MTVREAASRLEISRSTCYALVASGSLKHYRIGGAIRISEEHIAEFLEGAERGREAAPSVARRPVLRHVRLPE
ncbi:helix-turn-helix domain-containing protein [Tautonia rosea]|uniref:helix-turn-helix domain-containing protein n=1 Tax=Tautonia rosea TaxID=2728037 RepID=UPI0014765143|nr:helix-turn-helix domain-containing protein [Tautonia rosea]